MLKFRCFLYFGILSLIMLSCKKDNSNSNTPDKDQIIAVLDEQVLNWNQGNIEGYMNGYSASDYLQFITKKGRTIGWKNVLDRYIKSYPSKKEMGNLQFKNLIINNISNDIAHAYGNWQLEKDSIVGGSFSLIFKKELEGWKIIIDHTW